MFETWLFYAFAALLLVSGMLVITARNPVHGVLFLVLAFFTAAGIWLLLRAEFLAIALTLRQRKDSRSQDPSSQVRVRRAERVELVSMRAEDK